MAPGGGFASEGLGRLNLCSGLWEGRRADASARRNRRRAAALPNSARSGNERRRPLAELQGDAPGVAQHGEHGAVGREHVLDVGGAGREQPRGVGAGVGALEREVQDQRMHGRVVGHGRGGVAVDLDHAARRVGEEMGLVGRGDMAHHAQPELGDIPGGEADGIGNVQGGVFEVHGGRACGAVAGAPFVPRDFVRLKAVFFRGFGALWAFP